MFIIKLYQRIEKFLVNVRDVVWNYPDSVFFDKDSLIRSFNRFYFKSRPFSHVALILLTFLLIGGMAINDITAVLRIHTDTLKEGVVVGQDEDGELLRVVSLNPLIITNVQLKRDIAELVYEPLLRVNQEGERKLVLAESYADIGEGKSYRFKLKEGVLWHDGQEFNADDVIATFELLKTLEFASQTSSVYSKAATKINATKIDDYRVEFSLIDQNSVIPNFFEVLAFKILPEHLMSDLDATNIIYPVPKLNRNPVGTGKFTVGSLNSDKVILKRFEQYHSDKPLLHVVEFKLFKDQHQAVSELQSGQIHSLIGINSENIKNLSVVPNLRINKSNVIYNQYWAMYFNMSDQGTFILKDDKVRRAIAYAINKKFMIEGLVGSALEADGPIPKTSFAYADDIARLNFDQEAANKLLDEAGWVMQENGIRAKAEDTLSLNIVYVHNPDRDKLVELIKDDLKSVGIEIVPTPKTINEVNNDHLLPSRFDILLYGVSTFIDPDRFELFHSSQIGYPNLNISSYVSQDETTVIRQGVTARVPRIDLALEKGRSIIDQQARKKEYHTFQDIVMKEMPVVYLYHPIYTYITNKRVQNVILQDMTSLEDRFNNIHQWYIEI